MGTKTNFTNDELKNRDNAREVAQMVKDAAQDEFAAARVAYAAYGKRTDNKNFRGEEMPKFDELPETIREAWRDAAAAVKAL